MFVFITERRTITSNRGPTACCHLFLRSSSSTGVSFTPVRGAHIKKTITLTPHTPKHIRIWRQIHISIHVAPSPR